MLCKLKVNHAAVVLFALVVAVLLLGWGVLLRPLYSNYAFIPFTPVCTVSLTGDAAQVKEIYGQLTSEFQQAYLETLWEKPQETRAGSVRVDADRRLLLVTARDWFAVRRWLDGEEPAMVQMAARTFDTLDGVNRLLEKRHGSIDREKFTHLYDVPPNAGIDECRVMEKFIIVGGKYAGDEQPLPGWKMPDWFIAHFTAEKRMGSDGNKTPWWYYVVTSLLDPDEPYDPEREKNKPHPGVPEIIPEAEDAP